MPVLTENNRLDDVVLWEEDNQYSRDKITVLSGENLALAAVVGVVTASGKYAEYDPDATDGTEDAAGILVAAVDATAADQLGVAIVRDAMIVAEELVWNAGVDAAGKTAALAELKALGIIVREQA